MANGDTVCPIKVWGKEEKGKWNEFREGFPEEVALTQPLNGISKVWCLGFFFAASC